MHGAAPDEARLDAAEAATHLAASARLIGTSDPELAAFFTAFTRYASPEDLIHYTGAELAALVKTAYAKIKTRVPASSLVEIFDPAAEDGAFARAETIVLAVNDDSPFLYDSATAEIRARGYRIAAAFHPVVDLARDGDGALSLRGTPLRESVIVLALEGVLDAAEMDSVRDGLLDVFASVKIVVRDWKPMLQRLADTAG
jgi:glutamate dehydrogenase